MARTPQDYWEKRQTELMKRLEKQSEGTIQRLVTAYNNQKTISKKKFKKYLESMLLMENLRSKRQRNC